MSNIEYFDLHIADDYGDEVSDQQSVDDARKYPAEPTVYDLRTLS